MKLMFILDHETFGDAWETALLKARPYADVVWLRMKTGDAGQIYERAVSVRKMLPDTPLLLSERADIARAAGCDGVQLGSSSLPADVIKAAFPMLTVGYSAHSIAEIASLKGADHATLSPLFPTPKPYPVTPLGALNVTAVATPVYALGGITAETLPLLQGEGYHGVAGIGFVKDIERIAALAKGLR